VVDWFFRYYWKAHAARFLLSRFPNRLVTLTSAIARLAFR
jgi:hypothetical protein